MIFVDSNIPMYLVGGDHPNKYRVVELVPKLFSVEQEFVTSAEAFQEIIHRYKANRDRHHLKIAYAALEDLVGRVEPVTKADTDGARTLAIEYSGLSSRDCLHLAVMKRLGCTKIWSFDQGFDQVSSVTRLA